MTSIKVFKKLPKGWRILVGALTAPRGTVWICNNKSRFSGEYQQALLKSFGGCDIKQNRFQPR